MSIWPARPLPFPCPQVPHRRLKFARHLPYFRAVHHKRAHLPANLSALFQPAQHPGNTAQLHATGLHVPWALALVKIGPDAPATRWSGPGPGFARTSLRTSEPLLPQDA